jgi:hypothetical protein
LAWEKAREKHVFTLPAMESKPVAVNQKTKFLRHLSLARAGGVFKTTPVDP